MNVSVQETADYVVVVIKKESASKGAVTPAVSPVGEAPPSPTGAPTISAPGPGTQDWTAGTGPAPGQRTEGDQKFFDGILKG